MEISRNILTKENLLEILDTLEIKHETIEHKEVFTVEEMLPVVAHLSGAQTKNLFLTDKKKRGFYLLSARHNANINLSDIGKQISAPGGLRFAKEELLYEKLGVKQGCVTALALVNDAACDVTFMVDEALVDGTFEKVFFHPLVNSATTGISPADFLKFLQHTGHKVIKLPLEVT